ncbi:MULTISPECIES: YtcA family lipoprotein [unclassified Undibacterium]|uniref:YtcA family lipoprotein n=1 Tax=unclassified Undibacterium TaxID=2630295 RepID=UPI002AC9A88A|nr:MULTISPECIES: YtcA family lipoprotein [unclassified Undibacterium]MEB0137728.1 YtcA family lipoprotein [Undibacterium sp. CCC2.1]MEB0172830.1 YtcA family lipoprotein [Undibacterium sp. CCC1.1]MEB0176696.1 YtcA family lipoprotein [Undibacterium sp. CCC3.4]MEB0215978.1 YtcA family lipoprotein [Undibacterium sp. 5I2]WPX42303.1 YtcA family lipoprotein [Undibacterium sp. CCC3.4]
MQRPTVSLTWLLSAATSTVLCGCTNAPSLNFLGAYFPDWMFCLLLGLVLMMAWHGLLSLAGWRAAVQTPASLLMYAVFAAIVAMLTWLLYF